MSSKPFNDDTYVELKIRKKFGEFSAEEQKQIIEQKGETQTIGPGNIAKFPTFEELHGATGPNGLTTLACALYHKKDEVRKGIPTYDANAATASYNNCVAGGPIMWETFNKRLNKVVKDAVKDAGPPDADVSETPAKKKRGRATKKAGAKEDAAKDDASGGAVKCASKKRGAEEDAAEDDPSKKLKTEPGADEDDGEDFLS